MKFKTFEKLCNALSEQLQEDIKRDRLLSEAIGGGSFVITENRLIDRTLDIVLEDMKANEWQIEIIWDIITNDTKEFQFEFEDIIYEATLQNAWLLLKGKLDKRYAKVIKNYKG